MRKLIIICSALFLMSFIHPFYVSICQIDHNPTTKSLEISFKIFTDDLEYSLEKQGTGRLFLGSEKESEKADQYIFNYLKNNFKITIDGQETEYSFLGKEIELDVTWCYLEAKNINDFTKIEVLNKILIDDFNSQSNIVHIKYGDKRKSMLLHKSKTRDIIEF